MKPAQLAIALIKAMPFAERLKLLRRDDVPVDMMDVVLGELSSDAPHLDLRMYTAIKNYCGHKLEPAEFAKLFPEVAS